MVEIGLALSALALSCQVVSVFLAERMVDRVLLAIFAAGTALLFLGLFIPWLSESKVGILSKSLMLSGCVFGLLGWWLSSRQYRG